MSGRIDLAIIYSWNNEKKLFFNPSNSLIRCIIAWYDTKLIKGYEFYSLEDSKFWV